MRIRAAAPIAILGHILTAILIIELTGLGRVQPPPEPMDVELMPPPAREIQAALAPAVAVPQPPEPPPPPPPTVEPPPPPPPDVPPAEPILDTPPPPPPVIEPPKPQPPPRKPPPPRAVAVAKPAKPVETPAAPADTARVVKATASAQAGPPDSGVGRVGNGKPVYPASMIDQEREGSADAVCDVLPTGEVSDCRLLGVQGGAAFGPAVLSFLKTQHYRPAIHDGQSVRAEYRYHFDFKLYD